MSTRIVGDIVDTAANSTQSGERQFLAGPPRFIKGSLQWLRRVGAAARRIFPGNVVSSAVSFRENQVFWGLRNLPVREAVKHFLICGTTGSGKTTAIQLFLQSIAPRIRPGRTPPEQLIIYDAKCDVLPLLAALGLRPEDEHVWILNPADARGAKWKLSEAVQEPIMARHLASLLVPEEKNSTSPYWADAGRELVYAAILGLNAAVGTRWELRDLLCALDSAKHLAAVAAHHPRAKVLAARVLDDGNHAPGVLSTLGSKLGQFEQVAALWHTNKSGRSFSISDFLSRPGVLVLGYDPVLKESIWPINALMIRALTQEILRRPNTREPRHWFVLDEFPSMERVDRIHELLNRGRSKGASMLLGIANVSGLMETYGEHRTNDILSLCTYKSFLRAGDATTAEWASKHFGQVRRIESSHGETVGSSGSSTSVQYQLQDRSAFLPASFLDLPLPESGGRYSMVSDVACLGTSFLDECPADDVFGLCLSPDESVAAVEPRTGIGEQTLLPWSKDEEDLYCGPKETAKRPKLAKRRQSELDLFTNSSSAA